MYYTNIIFPIKNNLIIYKSQNCSSVKHLVWENNSIYLSLVKQISSYNPSSLLENEVALFVF